MITAYLPFYHKEETVDHLFLNCQKSVVLWWWIIDYGVLSFNTDTMLLYFKKVFFSCRIIPGNGAKYLFVFSFGWSD